MVRVRKTGVIDSVDRKGYRVDSRCKIRGCENLESRMGWIR